MVPAQNSSKRRIGIEMQMVNWDSWEETGASRILIGNGVMDLINKFSARTNTAMGVYSIFCMGLADTGRDPWSNWRPLHFLICCILFLMSLESHWASRKTCVVKSIKLAWQMLGMEAKKRKTRRRRANPWYLDMWKSHLASYSTIKKPIPSQLWGEQGLVIM